MDKKWIKKFRRKRWNTFVEYYTHRRYSDFLSIVYRTILDTSRESSSSVVDNDRHDRTNQRREVSRCWYRIASGKTDDLERRGTGSVATGEPVGCRTSGIAKVYTTARP